MSFDASEEPVEFEGPRIRVDDITRDAIVLLIWSDDTHVRGLGADQIELSLAPDQARWLAESLGAAIASMGEARPNKTASGPMTPIHTNTS